MGLPRKGLKPVAEQSVVCCVYSSAEEIICAGVSSMDSIIVLTSLAGTAEINASCSCK